jgi:hypothetical protein
MVKMMERNDDRRIFYIDIGDMPRIDAEKYLKEMMEKYGHKPTKLTFLTLFFMFWN